VIIAGDVLKYLLFKNIKKVSTMSTATDENLINDETIVIELKMKECTRAKRSSHYNSRRIKPQLCDKDLTTHLREGKK